MTDKEEFEKCPNCGCEDWETELTINKNGTWDGSVYEKKDETRLLKYRCCGCGYEEDEKVEE